MKKFASIAAVVGLLLAAAIYYGNLNQSRQGTPVEPPVEPTPSPLVQAPVIHTPTPVGVVGQPSTSAVSQGTLKMTSAISHGYVAAGANHEMYATVDLQAIKFGGESRPALNLALVIDRSGSMSGDKFEHARNAARRLVETLSPQDRIAIISYGSDVTVELSSRPVTLENRPAMLQAINGMSIGGGTNLSGGYERGLQEVQRWKDGQSVNRVILMSDGNANIGVTYLPDLERMARQGLADGVSLTTMGLGLDYNEDLMTRMANEGAGKYYYIDDFGKIASALDQELKGLSTIVARNTALVITMAPGVSLKQLYGYPVRQEGQRLMIPLAEFYSEQSKNILFKLGVAAGAPEGKLPILDVQLSYTDASKDVQAHQQSSLHSVVTSQQPLLSSAVDVSVISRVQQVEVAQTLQEAMNKYERGDVAGANEMLSNTQQRMRHVRQQYEPLRKNEAYDRVDQEMDKLKTSIQAAPAASGEGRALRKASKARSNYIMMDSSAF